MNVVDTAARIGWTLAKIADNVGDARRDAGKVVRHRRQDTAHTLHGAADSLRATGDQVRERIDEVVSGVANRLEDAAHFVEGRNGRRRHSTAEQLLVAGGITFLVGFAMWRLTRTS